MSRVNSDESGDLLKADKKKRYKVLIVDDAPENIHLLIGAIKDEYATVAATSGERALQIALKEPRPDIILSDVIMPDMDGYELCRRLKKDSRTRDIPVIFVTALDDHENEEEGLRAGAIDYLIKPFRAPIVRARLKNHLALRDAHSRLEEQNQDLKEAAALREDVERITQHDLKGPLGIIMGVPQLLMDDENLNSGQQEALKLVLESGYTMLEMVNRSLDLYRMEVGTYSYQPVALNLIPVLHKVFGELKDTATAYGVSVVLNENGRSSTTGQEFNVQGEELLCHTLFSNLVRNAIEASSEGEQVNISLGGDDMKAIVSIHNRVAVPEEIRAGFFDKYTTHGKSKGTGLGTYSALLATRTQGGKISMTTSDAEGTILKVELQRE
ncbi:hybrid sensor histidine kinase/response regulator [Myxococcota bacterium]|nr:hybrid sensor histidine kinase/response regulator [Myxococcota bacterium]